MDIEQFEKIMNSTESNISNVEDNAFDGLVILRKYKKYVLQGAEHDEFFGPDVQELIDKGITVQDIIALAKLNWHIVDSEYVACFV